MRLKVSPTPSNTPSYTPTNTPTNTECPIGCFDVEAFCCEVSSLYLDPIFGSVFVAGNVENYGTNSGLDTVFKLQKNGNYDGSFIYTAPSIKARKVIQQSGGNLLIAGDTVGGGTVPKMLINRITSTGSLDGTFTLLTVTRTDSGVAGSNDFGFQSDGKIVVGGTFNTVSGVSYNNLCRINPNGSLDTSFNIGTGFNARVLTVVIQPDDKILVSGNFNTYSGFTSQGIIRLNADGTIDSTFTSPIIGALNTFALLPNGKIICQVGATIRRLNSNGTIDTGFTAVIMTGGLVDTYAIEPFTNKIFAGGTFLTVNGVSIRGLVKIDDSGNVDTSFDIGTGFRVIVGEGPRTIVRKLNGNLLVGGFFDEYNGVSISGFLELTPTGELFSCDLGPCYIYSAIRTGSGSQGQVRFRDCNGFITNSVIKNTVEPQLFCATEIYWTSEGIILSGGTDIATNCCFRFINVGSISLGSVAYRDCNGNIVSNAIPLGGTFCAQYITQIGGAGDYIQEPLCIAVTPTTTASRTPTPTRTPTVTPTNTNTQTQTQSSTSDAIPTTTPTNTQTQTPSPTSDAIPSPTPTNTSTPTGTSSVSPSPTPTTTPTPTGEPVPECISYNVQGEGFCEYEDCSGFPQSFFCDTYCNFTICTNGVISSDMIVTEVGTC